VFPLRRVFIVLAFPNWTTNLKKHGDTSKSEIKSYLQLGAVRAELAMAHERLADEKMKLEFFGSEWLEQSFLRKISVAARECISVWLTHFL